MPISQPLGARFVPLTCTQTWIARVQPAACAAGTRRDLLNYRQQGALCMFKIRITTDPWANSCTESYTGLRLPYQSPSTCLVPAEHSPSALATCRALIVSALTARE